jgi:aspartate/methionine/tyrosine aminotransferase
MTILFEEGVLHKGQYLKPANVLAGEIVKPLIEQASFDKCFVYHLLASRGICVVPLSSGFNSDLQGFRITLLEPDGAKFRNMLDSIAEGVKEFLGSN